MLITGITANVSVSQITEAVNKGFTNKQKIQLAKKMSDFCGMTDMSYVEELLVMAAKLRLQAIKKDRALYNRNRPYFKALKTITKVKTAE